MDPIGDRHGQIVTAATCETLINLAARSVVKIVNEVAEFDGIDLAPPPAVEMRAELLNRLPQRLLVGRVNQIAKLLLDGFGELSRHIFSVMGRSLIMSAPNAVALFSTRHGHAPASPAAAPWAD